MSNVNFPGFNALQNLIAPKPAAATIVAGGAAPTIARDSLSTSTNDPKLALKRQELANNIRDMQWQQSEPSTNSSERCQLQLRINAYEAEAGTVGKPMNADARRALLKMNDLMQEGTHGNISITRLQQIELSQADAKRDLDRAMNPPSAARANVLDRMKDLTNEANTNISSDRLQQIQMELGGLQRQLDLDGKKQNPTVKAIHAKMHALETEAQAGNVSPTRLQQIQLRLMDLKNQLDGTLKPANGKSAALIADIHKLAIEAQGPVSAQRLQQIQIAVADKQLDLDDANRAK